MTMVYNRNYAQFETIFDFYIILPYHATKLARRQTTKHKKSQASKHRSILIYQIENTCLLFNFRNPIFNNP